MTNSTTGIPSVLTLSPTGDSTELSGTIQDGVGGVSLVMNGTGTREFLPEAEFLQRPDRDQRRYTDCGP